MEIGNDSCKLVAQARELIKQYLDKNHLENEKMLETAILVLDKALEKLTDII